MKSKPVHAFNRRNFLKVSATGLLGAGVAAKAAAKTGKDEPENLKIKAYHTLGRTGFRVSDIALGQEMTTNTKEYFKFLLSTGLNYIDTSPIYGNSEAFLGSCLGEFARKSLFITTKFYPEGEITKDAVLNSFRRSLETLKLDYVDCYMLQNAKFVSEVNSKGFHDAMQQLKQEGRVRFVGAAGHGANWVNNESTETMEQVLTAAANDGRYDIILFVYNFLNYEQSNAIIKACKGKGIGTIAMKTDPVSLYHFCVDYREKYLPDSVLNTLPPSYMRTLNLYEKSYEQAADFKQKYGLKDDQEVKKAATKYVLSNPDVDTMLISFKSTEDIETYIPLSGEKLTACDRSLLDSYAQYFSTFYCRHACGICESACPHKVPVNTLLRYRHYLVGNGREAYALRKYNSLKGPKADLCSNCEGFCERACPYGVHAQAMLQHAHKELNLG